MTLCTLKDGGNIFIETRSIEAIVPKKPVRNGDPATVRILMNSGRIHEVIDTPSLMNNLTSTNAIDSRSVHF